MGEHDVWRQQVEAKRRIGVALVGPHGTIIATIVISASRRLAATIVACSLVAYLQAIPEEGKRMPNLTNAASRVSEIAAADAGDALRHFERLLTLETDCWDVHEAIRSGSPDFVLLDVRAPQSFQAGHLPGATNLPHGRINERNLSAYPAGTLFVVYCDGPHCNGADRAAANLARLGRKVKKMIGGIAGWKDGGFNLTAR